MSDAQNSMHNNPPIWAAHYPSDLKWDTEIRSAPVFELLQNTAKLYSDRPALDFMGKSYTWGQIADLTCRMAKGLQNIGIKKGDHIGIFLPNSPYYIISYYAVLMTGARVVNLNPLYAQEELKTLINDSEVKIIISADLTILHDKMSVMLRETSLERLVVCPFAEALPFPKNLLFKILKRSEIASVDYGGQILRYGDLINNDGNCAVPDIDPVNDIAVLQYTGGTTGVPKAAMLTHGNVYTNAMQAVLWFRNVETARARILGVLPFFHVFAMTAVMNFSVAKALEIVALPRFDLKQTLKAIARKKVHLFPAVPAIYNAINLSPLRDKYDLSSLRYCLSGGAPLPQEIKQRFEANTGCKVIEGYGLTESAPVACVNLPDGLYKPGSIGLPWPQTLIEIINPDDKITLVKTGERGELCITGPQVMKGYWKNEAATNDVLRRAPDGDLRLHTGDIAIMDEDGFVFIVDRLKDMIITNGYNVYPRNVEEAIYQHPDVAECIVAGIPDKDRGEIVKAWVTLKDGKTLNDEDLRAFLADKISPMEIPRRIEWRNEPLPKTMIGKLSRKDVLAQEKEG